MTDIPNVPHLESAVITLSFPCVAEYVSIARLAVLGIASRMPLSYDEVEDVRLAVGEACTHAVERASRANGAAPSNDGFGSISITSKITEGELTIEVADDVPASDSNGSTVDDDDLDRTGLGALLMEILVDHVDIQSLPTGTNVRLIKRPSSEH